MASTSEVNRAAGDAAEAHAVRRRSEQLGTDAGVERLAALDDLDPRARRGQALEHALELLLVGVAARLEQERVLAFERAVEVLELGEQGVVEHDRLQSDREPGEGRGAEGRGGAKRRTGARVREHDRPTDSPGLSEA
jgi:hypothetical protein